ncbi:TPR-like protein [Marasmius fiardii PR-910]|nr:TPR-like protein [Marasmius fiardii PR-910]
MKDAWLPDHSTLFSSNTTGFDHLHLDRAFEVEESDEIEAARRCMESRHYIRAAHYAKGCRSLKGVFLYVYSKFIVSEQIALAEWHKADGTRFQPPLPINNSIGELLEVIEDSKDPFLKFLKALFCQRLSRAEDAMTLLLESLSAYPWNWSAWLLLASCIDTKEELTKAISRSDVPPNHPLPNMLLLKTYNDLHSPTPMDLKICEQLLDRSRFPNSLWVMTQRARTLFNLAALSKAESQFEQILKLDPDRVDDIDVYADILYASQKREKLSALADAFSKKDQDRPEVCCLLGVHMRLEHEKSVKYLKRATRLDPTCLQAWTHLGFVFMEIGNPPAAIEAFRRALDLSKKDYKPWCGMAQAYMILNLPLYALYYYSKASTLISYEASILEGVASCYELLGRYHEAIACYKRMISRATNTAQTIALHVKVVKAYKALDDAAEVANSNYNIIKAYEAEGIYKLGQPIPDHFMRSMVECAEYHAKAPEGNLLLAHDYLKVCLATPGVVIEATTVLNMVRAKARQIGSSLADDEGRFSLDHRKGMMTA